MVRFLDDALRSNLSSQIYYLYVYISKEAFIIYHNIHNSKDLNVNIFICTYKP